MAKSRQDPPVNARGDPTGTESPPSHHHIAPKTRHHDPPEVAPLVSPSRPAAPSSFDSALDSVSGYWQSLSSFSSRIQHRVSMSKCPPCKIHAHTNLVNVILSNHATPLRLTLVIFLFGIAYLIVDPLDLRMSFHNDKKLTWSQLVNRLDKAQNRLNERLHEEYGHYTSLLWNSTVIHESFRSNSLHRLKRRMMLKIVQAGLLREKGEWIDISEITFTWVTAGDGAAAGYGNLFHQAYTQIIEDTAKDSFNMLGIRFIANNYAMDGVTSGPELALCMDSIFGSDIDILSWDFYETDKEQVELYQLWGNRAGVHPSFPALFLQNNEEYRAEINRQLDSVGLCTVGFNADYIRSLLPDSKKTTADDLPFALRNYKCNGKVEQGDCEMHKWNTSCDLAQYQISSRSGWKDHLLIGRAIGVFLVNLLRDALDELQGIPLTPLTMSNLTIPQIQDRNSFISANLHETHLGLHVNKNTNFLGGLARFSPFWKTSSFCHSALLPNQARYDGMTTMGKRGIRHAGGYYSDFDIGHSINNLPTLQAHTSDELLLVFRPESHRNCSTVFHVDYKDFFGIRTEDGWVRVPIPNENEMKQFAKQNDRYAHAIVLCDSICDSDQCKSRVSVGNVASDDIEITVDGGKVLSVKNLELHQGPSRCYLLIGEHDSFLWINGSIKINAKGMLQLSSFILI